MKSKYLFIGIMLSISMITNAQVKIHTGGNVSLGSTTAPPSGFKLQLIGNSVFSANNGSITSSAYIRCLNGYSTATNPDYTWWGNDQVGIFHPSNNVIGFSSYGKERMRVTPSCVQINSSGDWAGSIFVNATTPNATGYGMRYGGSDNFYVHASGWIYSQGQYISSDKKFKKNVKTISNSLNKVMQLRGVNYKLNRSDSMSIFNTNDFYMGVVAQEVEEVVPEVVKTFPDGTKAVAYQNLIGLLIEAIKEQQIQIESLQNNILNCCNSNNKTKSFKSSTGVASTDEIDNGMVKNILYQNSPNPFTQNTQIKYYLTDETRAAVIYLFDMQGTLLKTYKTLDKGYGKVNVNGGDLNAGMYIYSLIVDSIEIDSKRMILTK